MYSGSRTSFSVPLPPGVSPGVVIGKGGSTIKGLQQRSGGARTVVNAQRGTVDLSGTPLQVQAAKALVQQTLASFAAQGGSYPHPLAVSYVLDASFGPDDSSEVTFKQRTDEVTHATDRPEKLYSLAPIAPASGRAAAAAGSDAPAGASTGADEQASALGGLSLGRPAKPDAFNVMPYRGRAAAIAQAVTAVERAVGHSPRFDDTKLRFNFGAALFYRMANPFERVTLRELQGRRIPQNLKSVYSNAVIPAVADTLERHLTGSLGFSLSEERQRISVHLQSDAGTGHALSFDKTSTGTVTLRKVKSQSNKLAFLTLITANPSSPDWRAKILAHYHSPAGAAAAPGPNASTLERLAAAARLLPAGGGSGGRRRLDLPGAAGLGLQIDRQRHKTKKIFTGTFRGEDVKVSINQVFNPEKMLLHTEVTGTAAGLNTLLMDALVARRLDASTASRVRSALEALLAFAEEVASAAAA